MIDISKNIFEGLEPRKNQDREEAEIIRYALNINRKNGEKKNLGIWWWAGYLEIVANFFLRLSRLVFLSYLVLALLIIGAILLMNKTSSNLTLKAFEILAQTNTTQLIILVPFGVFGLEILVRAVFDILYNECCLADEKYPEYIEFVRGEKVVSKIKI